MAFAPTLHGSRVQCAVMMKLLMLERLHQIATSIAIAAVLSLFAQFAEASQRAEELLKLAAEADVPASDPLPEFWLDEDAWHVEVGYITTPEEVEAYRRLETVGQRAAFIAQFWRRRDPIPGTLPNEYREEYERRIQYAITNCSDPDSPGSHGFQTARGRLYVLLGIPDEIVPEAGGPPTHEVWRYRNQLGAVDDLVVQFAQSRVMSCEYPMRILSPDPIRIFEAAARPDSRGAAESPVSVSTHARGFASMLIPMDLKSAVGVRWELRSGGTAVESGQLGFATEEEILKSGETRGFAAHLVVPPFDSRGFACTKALPAGSYVLSTAVGYLGGRVHREEVVFTVE